MDTDIRDQVRRRYAKAITGKKSCCSAPGCCGGDASATNPITGNLYAASEVSGLPPEALVASFGCGNPTALTPLYAGETVLDLGSGAGLDVLLSARRVSPGGKAYGLDMTDEMLAAAEENRAKAGITNAEFIKGHIEEIPLPDNSVDVVISNCVINLSVDKDKVFREIFRVLRPGGRLAVSDIVTTRPLPDKVRNDLMAWAGCVAGALSDKDYSDKLTRAGFSPVELEVTRVYNLEDRSGLIPGLAAEELAEINGSIVSAFIRAKKPLQKLTAGVDFKIRPASLEDEDATKALLTGSALITAGVSEMLENFMVAESGGIVGTIGYFRAGDNIMLRSFAVTPALRKTRLAEALFAETIAKAKATGVKTAYLFTNTAENYFKKHGFRVIPREEIPADLQVAPGLSACCHADCAAMMLKL